MAATTINPREPDLVTPLQVASRVAASLLGGYVLVWGFISLGTALGVAAGATYADAHASLRMLAFPVFVAAFCWAFVARSTLRVWLYAGGGGALMTLAAWWLVSRLS